jgi:hypothetical protein
MNKEHIATLRDMIEWHEMKADTTRVMIRVSRSEPSIVGETLGRELHMHERFAATLKAIIEDART